MRAFTSKPVLLSETAVGPAAGQFAKIQNLFHGMATYKTLGLVWFDKAQHSGIYHQDWRIEGQRPGRGSRSSWACVENLAPTLLPIS